MIKYELKIDGRTIATAETDEGHTPPEVMEKMIVAVFAAKAEKEREQINGQCFV